MALYKHFNRLKRMCVDTCLLCRMFLQDFLNRTILKIKEKDIIPKEAVIHYEKGSFEQKQRAAGFLPDS